MSHTIQQSIREMINPIALLTRAERILSIIGGSYDSYEIEKDNISFFSDDQWCRQHGGQIEKVVPVEIITISWQEAQTKFSKECEDDPSSYTDYTEEDIFQSILSLFEDRFNLNIENYKSNRKIEEQLLAQKRAKELEDKRQKEKDALDKLEYTRLRNKFGDI